jgi:hypothetical protein
MSYCIYVSIQHLTLYKVFHKDLINLKYFVLLEESAPIYSGKQNHCFAWRRKAVHNV